MWRECAAGSLNWSIVSTSTISNICILSEKFLNPRQAFRLANYICHRTDGLTARCGTSILVRRSIVHHSMLLLFKSHWPPNRWKSLRLTSPLPARWSERTCPLLRQGIAGLDGRRPQRQTRGLELTADHKTGETPAWLCRRELLSDLWSGHHKHQPIPPLCYSRCLGYCHNQEPHILVVSDVVFCTKLRPPPANHWHYVSVILPAHNGSPWFQAHQLSQPPISLGRSNTVRFGLPQRDGNRLVRWELLRRRSESSGGMYSQVSAAWRPTTSDTGVHSGWDSLKNRLLRQWKVTRIPALNAEINHL